MSSRLGVILAIILGALIFVVAVVLTFLSCTNPRMLVPGGSWPSGADIEKGGGGGEASAPDAPAEAPPVGEGEAPADVGGGDSGGTEAVEDGGGAAEGGEGDGGADGAGEGGDEGAGDGDNGEEGANEGGGN
ncbi:MAG: hypothetical protein M1833_000449 [Piccolia ochrophora]|nr:MAG: hypothetical protein M1833_000449 [Piccolia ochrophora]